MKSDDKVSDLVCCHGNVTSGHPGACCDVTFLKPMCTPQLAVKKEVSWTCEWLSCEYTFSIFFYTCDIWLPTINQRIVYTFHSFERQSHISMIMMIHHDIHVMTWAWWTWNRDNDKAKLRKHYHNDAHNHLFIRLMLFILLIVTVSYPCLKVGTPLVPRWKMSPRKS